MTEDEVMSTDPPLTTTSYAILGLLAVRPFTTYEIAQQMDRALGHFWPRARSKIYEEPKKLVVHGLARAKGEQHGRRPRTVYSITPKGRRALAAWLHTPGDGPVVEWEQLVKTFFCEFGSKADLLATIEAARRWSVEQTLATGGIADEYLDGNGPYPERLPWLVLVGQFLDDFLVLVEQWAEWAAAQVEDWPDEFVGAPADRGALEGQSRRFRRVSGAP
jgi:PadR family transcriptional regulator, regulatory protein AphA